MKLIDAELFKAKYLCRGYIPEMSEKEFDSFCATNENPIVNAIWERHLMPLALKCSNCKKTIAWKRKIDYNYCPNCGAKMSVIQRWW